MEYSDEQLMDYADGLLEEEETAAIAAAIKDDPDLGARVEDFRASFALAALADELVVSEAPTFEEITERITKRTAEAESREEIGLLLYLRYLWTPAMAWVISLSITFAGSTAISLGFIAWRTQQALMSFQGPAIIFTRQAAHVLRSASADEKGKYRPDPEWFQKGPLIFNLQAVDRFDKDPRYEMHLGYISEGQNIPVNTGIRVNFAIDAKEFLDAQGLWCLIMNSCAKEGEITLDHESNKGEKKLIKKITNVSPGELTLLYKGRISKPVGADKVTVTLKVGDQTFSRTVAYKVTEN